MLDVSFLNVDTNHMPTTISFTAKKFPVSHIRLASRSQAIIPRYHSRSKKAKTISSILARFSFLIYEYARYNWSKIRVRTVLRLNMYYSMSFFGTVTLICV